MLHQLETALRPLIDGDCIPKLANLDQNNIKGSKKTTEEVKIIISEKQTPLAPLVIWGEVASCF